jgi:hypothetical protein
MIEGDLAMAKLQFSMDAVPVPNVFVIASVQNKNGRLVGLPPDKFCSQNRSCK